MINNISEYLENEARSKVRSAVLDYKNGNGLRGMYGLFLGLLGWRVEYSGKGHHVGAVVDAVHDIFAQDKDSEVDLIYKQTLEALLTGARTLEQYQCLKGVIIKELDKELKGTNSFTIDVEDTISKFGELVTNANDVLIDEFKKVNADFDEDFLEVQRYVLLHFGLFIDVKKFEGRKQLNFLYPYIGGDIEFSDLTEEDLRAMLKKYRECLPKNQGINKIVEHMVQYACEDYNKGDNKAFKRLLLGIEEGNLTCFVGAGHNYKLIIDSMHKLHSCNPECRVKDALESCLIDLIVETSNAYELKLLVNTAMYEERKELLGEGSFKIDIEKLTSYFIDNIKKNHDQYKRECSDFDKWLEKKPIAREKTPIEQAKIRVILAGEKRKEQLILLRKYVGWDNEYDDMSEADIDRIYVDYAEALESFKGKNSELLIRVEEAVQRYHNGDKELFKALIRGTNSEKVEFISGTGHAYRIIIDSMHELYKNNSSCGIIECIDDCLYDMAEAMVTIKDVEEMMDLLIYELEKEHNQSASFKINSYDISAAMRRNTQDNEDRYLAQDPEYDEIEGKLVMRAKRICDDYIL